MTAQKGKVTETTWGKTKSGIPYREVKKDGEIYITLLDKKKRGK